MLLALKTLSYGTIHVAVATTVAYAITNNLAMSLSMGLIEPVVQTFVFALHDYAWEGHAGKNKGIMQHTH